MMRMAMMTKMGWQVKEMNRDMTDSADEMNLETDSKGEVMHIYERSVGKNY